MKHRSDVTARNPILRFGNNELKILGSQVAVIFKVVVLEKIGEIVLSKLSFGFRIWFQDGPEQRGLCELQRAVRIRHPFMWPQFEDIYVTEKSDNCH